MYIDSWKPFLDALIKNLGEAATIEHESLIGNFEDNFLLASLITTF